MKVKHGRFLYYVKTRPVRKMVHRWEVRNFFGELLANGTHRGDREGARHTGKTFVSRLHK